VIAWLVGLLQGEDGVLRNASARLVTAIGVDTWDDVLARMEQVADRARLGRLLAEVGDPRPGVGTILRSGQKLPDIVWGGEVPAGRYTIGGDAHAGEARKQVPIKQPYRLARYPVTYVQFQCFVDALDFDDERWWVGMPAEVKGFWAPIYPLREMAEQRFPFANHPRENVSWYQAMAFCRWLTARLHAGELPAGELTGDVGQYEITLPHEYEWEVAARWLNSDVFDRLYPWGPEFDAAKANTAEGGIRQTTAVGIYPAGQNATLGLYDLSGNVWEWCRNKYKDPDDEAVDGSNAWRVLRGGSWGYGADDARAAYRDGNNPAARSGISGFRLVVVGGGGASSPISIDILW
ncbi:MAG: SUMF1/EgtB/PvdO family nonheme iron enzyme, partial [Pseudomonadales bacterium]|nr:SUMF1/EgtB/PvdO family nonheme iron enzyme [Pseudomonadales bacterium]